MRFDIERLNELEVHYRGSTPGELSQGFRTVLVSEADHPFWEHWWPQGHMIGWEHTFVHEIHHFLSAIREDTDIAPARRDVRGRLPRRRDLRRDAALRRERRAARPCLPVLGPIADGNRASSRATMPGMTDEIITEEVTAWPGVTAGARQSRGEYSFKVGAREIGHLHGDRVAAHRVSQGRLAGALRRRPDRLPPGVPRQAGFGARDIRGEDDVRDVIALLRLNYDRVVARYGLPVA